MTTRAILNSLIVGSLLLTSCSGGGTGDNNQVNDLTDLPGDGSTLNSDPVSGEASPSDPSDTFAPSERARYRVTLENLWGVEAFPQGFPDDAHLSLIGGATHNAAVSFWDEGETASRGIEDMAEAGLIDKLLFDEVAPAIINGTADSTIEIREYTDANIDGVAGVNVFEITLNADWPLVSLVTMLGPSPDWFVGVSGLSLYNDGAWSTQLSMELPLYDAGTKSDITPIMGGPDIIPPDPIGLVAYHAATGVYLPSTEPQTVARLTFHRIASTP